MPSALPMSKQQTKNVCKYEKLITIESKKNGLEPALLASLIYIESAFKPRVVSKSNACGLTQVIPKYTGGPETGYKKYTCEQLKNPRTSIIVGAKILGYLKRVYAKGNEDNALCMYAAGTICLKNKTLHETLFYVRKVRTVYDTITNDC
tara:strand:+ start:2802 stop:3248 length:447 start_codon:yes stop_codon:yes gene_type:complete